MMEDREKAFQIRMEAFPSHFDLEIKLGFTTVNRKNLIQKLSGEMESTGFDLEAEWTRAYNFLSFLHWRLGDHKSAKMYSDKALLTRQDDVMALANQAWMHWKRREISETQCIVEKLEQLKGRQELIVITKAEQAFAYTRFGPRYYKKAVQLFKDVIASATECKIEETYINLWKFGLGLTLKRQLHFLNVFSFDHLSNHVDSFKEAIGVLFDVANNANTPRYRARCWVALGELADSIHNHEMLSPQDREGLPQEVVHKRPDEFFDTALSICSDDVYVLERCGKHARYCRDYKKSIQHLTRSVQIRGTSLGHHHLAKTIRSDLNKEIGAYVHKRSRGFCEPNNRQYFYTPVQKFSDEGYKKFLQNEKARRKLFPDGEQNMKDVCKGKGLVISSVFENKSTSLSSPQGSTVPKSESIKCRASDKNDSGIFSLETTDDLTTKLACFTISDLTPSSQLEGKTKHEPQRQASNEFSAGDQASAVEKDLIISRQGYNPASVGERKGHEYGTYKRVNSEHSFTDRDYPNVQGWNRGGAKRPQGTRFGGGRSRGHIRGRSRGWGPRLARRSESVPITTSMSEGKISRQISYPGGEDKKENKFSLTPFLSQQSTVIMPMGSPQKVLHYPPNEKRVEKILYHLEKALEYAPTNCAASYDKGLVFRSLGRLQDAVELFIEIRNQKECSPFQAVLCMEQHALCLQEIAETENDPCKKEALNTNAKDLLFEAIEQIASIASQVPRFQPRGTAFPSLKEMLVRQDKRKEPHKTTTLREFARLYELVGKYGYALSFYTKIVEMSEEDSKDPDIVLKMAQNYVKLRDFRNSLLFFDLIETSCTRLADENRRLYFEAYIEGALFALKQDNGEKARSRFKRTVRFCRKRKFLSEDGAEECSYDIHIQTSRNAEESGYRLFDLFTRTCGLKVSLNDNQTTEELKYEGIYAGISDIMEQSCLIIFILDGANLQKGDLRYYINMAIDLNVDNNLGTGIMSICLGVLNVPGEIKQFPVFLQPPHLDFSKQTKDEQHLWLRDFFWKAAEDTFSPAMPKMIDKTDSD